MKVSLGPLSIHAMLSGRVVENTDGSMDISVVSRDGNLRGSLFLSTDDVETIRIRKVRKCNEPGEGSVRECF